jgi:hypothetical protein
MFKSPFFATKTEQFGQIFKGVLFCICSQFLVPLQRINELDLTDYPPHWPNLVHFQESKRFERMEFSPNELVTTAVDNLLEFKTRSNHRIAEHTLRPAQSCSKNRRKKSRTLKCMSRGDKIENDGGAIFGTNCLVLRQTSLACAHGPFSRTQKYFCVCMNT